MACGHLPAPRVRLFTADVRKARAEAVGVLVPVADDAVEQPHRDRSVLVLPSGTFRSACVPVFE